MRLAALACWLAVAAAAQADTTHEYDVVFDGKKGGAQTTVVGADGRLKVTYSHRNNGRGPDLAE